MCGLVGIISRNQSGFFHADAKMFENMLVFDTVRGRDSTGAVVIQRTGVAKVIKQAGDPFLMYRNREWGTMIQDMTQSGRIVLGHNRAATRGEVSSLNAHPFIEDNIILMHNGTLWEHKNLSDEAVTVDSHAIAKALREDTPDNVLPEIRGAFALLWYDAAKEMVYATRNEERPLFLCETKEGYVLVSEPWIAMAACSRENRKIEIHRQLEPGELLEFDLSGKMNSRMIGLKKHIKQTQQSYYNQRWDAYMDDPDCGIETTKPPFVAGQRPCALTKTQQEAANRSTTTNSKMIPQNTENGFESSTETPSGAVVVEADTNKDRIIQLFDSTDFKQGEEILVHIVKVNEIGQRFQFHGVVIEPNREAVDISGLLPYGTDPADVQDWLAKDVVAKIAGISATICGITLKAFSVAKTGTVTTNNKEISGRIWLTILNSCHCKTCGHSIKPQDRLFTNVYQKAEMQKEKLLPVHQLSVMCADCIESKLPDGEIKDDFTTRRLAAWEDGATVRGIIAVQNGQQRLRGASEGTSNILHLQAPKSLQ